MKQQSSKLFFLLLCLYLPARLMAQHFRYQCLTDKVPQTGFYSIAITPELSAHMQTNFSDVRIWDNKDRQVPYIVRSHRPKWQNSFFKAFPVIENSLDDSGRSVIIIQKNVAYSISNLALIIRNASVSRYASLSGSNDGKKWFIISERILINESYETLADSSIQAVAFPASAYSYFRLRIDNGTGDPLNIRSIGYYTNPDYRSINPYTNNPRPQVVQTDSSNGISYIKILQQQPYHVDQIRYEIEGPKYFSRYVSILVPEPAIKRKRAYLNEVSRFSVSATSVSQTEFPVFKYQEFYLAIQNGDNPPLTIKNLTTAQEYHELIAWLESGKQYRMMMDANDAAMPQYDLQQFQDSIPAMVQPLSIRGIQPVEAATTLEKAHAFPQKWIWLIMAGVVALLALLTWRLTSEMRKV